MLNFLNQNSGFFAVIFSAVVATATAVYAILTWKLTSETRKMREAQTEPKISIIIEPREEWINFVDMVIENIGSGPAYNIEFKVNPDFEYTNGQFLSKLGFIKNGLKYLSPNQRLRFFLTSMIENFEEKVKTPFEIKVTYKNSIGKTYEDLYLIDFSQLVGLSQLGEPPLYKISKNIEGIQKDIHLLTVGNYRIGVVTYTKENVEEEKRKLSEWANQSRKKDK